MQYFAYVHCKPDGTPFYVGKGKMRRAKYLGERNNHHKATVKKYGKDNILIGTLECSNEDTAFELEKGLIKCLKRMGVKLANYTDGGEGGSNPCEETRKRLSEAAKKRGVSESCKLALLKANTGRALPEKHKLKLSEAMKGKIFTEEHRRNISASAKKRGISDKVREASRKALTGSKQSDEAKDKKRMSMLAHWDKKGRKPKEVKQGRKSSWGEARPTRAVYVNDVYYPSLKEAAKAIGLSSSHLVHALKKSGVTKGFKVREAKK